MKLDKIGKFIGAIDEHKGGKTMFDVFFDFLIGVVENARVSLKKLNRIQRIIAVIFYCVEVITLLIVNVNIKMYKSDKIKMYNHSKLT